MLKINHFILILSIICSSNVLAESSQCEANDLIGPKMIKSLCLDCFEPISLANVHVGGKGILSKPSGAYNSIACSCNDKFGVPEFGLSYSMRAPAYLVETVRQGGCSPTLGRQIFNHDKFAAHGKVETSDSISFRHINILPFPFVYIVGALTDFECSKYNFYELDLADTTIFDPTWDDEVLQTRVNPMVRIGTGAYATAFQLAEGASLAVGGENHDNGISAGAWGLLNPSTGFSSTGASPVQHSSLITFRRLNSWHQRGFGTKTYGSDALCKGKTAINMPKNQYSMNMVQPVTDTSSLWRLGTPTLLTSEWKLNMWGEDDFTFMIWTYNDCCKR